MSDLGNLSKVLCANNELEINTDESDELKIDTDELKIDADELKIDTNKLKITFFDRFNELLRTVEKRNLATFRRVNFIYDVNNDEPDIDELELRTARFLGSLPQLQTLQLDGWASTGRLLQRTIAEATVTSFRELKTVIWGSHGSPLDELLPLWTFPVEHIEVIVTEPVARSWPAPTSSLRRLNLHCSTITDRTLKELLSLSPCLELLRYHHLCHVDRKLSSFFGLCLV
jgi:hypothetical protein